MRTRFVRGATLKQEESTAFSDTETKKTKPKKASGQLRYVLDFEVNRSCACGNPIGVIGYAVPGGDRMCYACASSLPKEIKKK